MGPRIALGRKVFAPSWTMTALTVLLLAAFVALGRWQWGRAEQKEALAREFAAGTAQRRAQPLAGRSTAALPRYAEISVTGEWDAARQFLLDNRIRDGQAGYEVLTPLRMADGRQLLVDRGWVPFEGRRDRLPQVASGLPRGPVTVRGRLDELPVAGLASGRAAPSLTGSWPRVTSFPRTTELAASLAADDAGAAGDGGIAAVRLEPRVLLLDAHEPAGFRRDWQPFAKGPEQNISYAVQWWSFGVLLLVLFVKLNMKDRDGT